MVFSGMADKGRDDPRLNRSEFGKAAAVGIASIVAGTAYLESHQDNSKDGFDPEIQDALERQGISADINLRIYVGNHYFTEETAEKMEDQGVTVLTGEIQSNPLSHTPENLEPGSLLAEFLANLTKIPNGVTSFGQMTLSQERSATLLRNFSESRAVLVADADPGVYTQTAANKVITGLGLVGSLVYLSEIARTTKILTEFNKPITRRDFLKKLGKGGLGLLFLHTTSAAYTTAENREWVTPAGNSEVSYLFSKLFKKGVDASTKYLELTEDARLVQAFESLVTVRDKIMALNNWYLIESLERNRAIKDQLTGPNGKVEIGFFSGAGHASVKGEFCKGPSAIKIELETVVTDWLLQYDEEMENASSIEEREDILYRYTSLMTVFNKPNLIKRYSYNNDIVEQGERIPMVESPAAIMYRTIIKKVESENSKGIDAENFKLLIGNMVRDQHFPDGTYLNIGGKNILANGGYTSEMTAKDPDALKKRFIETNFISPDDLEQIAGEVYPNLYHYDYIGDVVDKKISVGLAIVRGIPMTFFQKEDTSFITTSGEK